MYNNHYNNDIEHAAAYIGKTLAKYGRIRVLQTKEKFGTARIYCQLGLDCLLTVTHPKCAHYSPYPNWLKDFDIMYLSRILPYLNFAVIPYQKFIYRLAYKAALKRWPHIQDEIIDSADYEELLKGIKK